MMHMKTFKYVFALRYFLIFEIFEGNLEAKKAELGIPGLKNVFL